MNRSYPLASQMHLHLRVIAKRAKLNMSHENFRPLAELLTRSAFPFVLCAAMAVCVQAQDAKQGTDESWTATTESLIPNFNPSRTIESHTKSGNRTIDKQRFEVLGLNGAYRSFSETETEIVEVDAVTNRTFVRRYRWDENGRRILTEVLEEDSHTAPSGNTRVERKISSADVNGNLQVVRREIVDTAKISADVEATESAIYQRDSYGGFTQVEQAQLLKTRRADDSVAIKTTTRLPDGNGRWKVTDVTEKLIKDDGTDRTTEEQVSRSDFEGRLYQTSRILEKEGDTATGEIRSTVENYSLYAPGYFDNRLHLNQRITATRKNNSTGEITEQQIEQPSAGNPSDGPKVIAKTRYVVKYAATGMQTTKTVENRDANGKFNTALVETQESTQAPPTQQATLPSHKH
jgi:hypothetical protein